MDLAGHGSGFPIGVGNDGFCALLLTAECIRTLESKKEAGRPRTPRSSGLLAGVQLFKKVSRLS